MYAIKDGGLENTNQFSVGFTTIAIVYGSAVLTWSDRPKAFIRQVHTYRIIEHNSQKQGEYALSTFVCLFRKVFCNENKGKIQIS